MAMKKTNLKLPENKGKLDIFLKNDEDDAPEIMIIGNPDGLRYLSELLKSLADYDQDRRNLPKGEREHIHLHANYQLGRHSCEVEVCRADAKGTGELPEFMR
jgi:hypothetical protein